VGLPIPDEKTLRDYVVGRRWFGAKSREVTYARILEAPVLREGDPALALALVEIGYETGTHDLYQLPLGVRADTGFEEVIDRLDGLALYDALEDPELARAFADLLDENRTVKGEHGVVEFRGEPVGAFGDVRPISVEQSNTSLVFDERLIFKVYRRLEAGINPELELLRFLTEHGFPNVPELVGWYAYVGTPMDATLGVLQNFVRGESDGWDFALRSLAGDPDEFLAQVARLGEVTGAMHSTLASESGDPSFSPETPSTEALALLVASVDEEIERLFANLPDLETLEPVQNRGEEIRDQLRLISSVGPFGKIIRHHGDYHLGQVIWTGDDWIVIDFEGEPARPLSERRRKRSPLRDVAGMLRSFAYAANASSLTQGIDPPDDWETRAREAFLDSYLATVDANLLPPGRQAIERLLAVFELEKAVYELRYELDNRPDWVVIPVAGIVRLLGMPVA
jgi:trehalose synthase-fused probable maltokinase